MKVLILIASLIGTMASAEMSYTPVKILTACDMSTTSCNSKGIQLSRLNLASIMAVFSGAPVGTLKIQVSNDLVIPCQNTDPACNVVNWVDYTGSSQAISAAGNFLWNMSLMGYKWVRLNYTKTSGTGTLDATFVGKGTN